jgi:hypothetical protein
VSGALSHSFSVEGAIEGDALLDVPTQRLVYDLQIRDVLAGEIIDIKLHRGGREANGPVVGLLGTERTGELSVRNEDLAALLEGDLYVEVYTRRKPQGGARGRIVPR